MTGLEKHRFLSLSDSQRAKTLQKMTDQELLEVLDGKDFEGKQYVIEHAERKGIVKSGRYSSFYYPKKPFDLRTFYDEHPDLDVL